MRPHLGKLFRGKMPKHIIYLTSARKIITDTETKTGKLLGSDHLCNILKPIMAGVASSRPNPYSSEWESQVIDSHYHIGNVDIFMLEPVTDCVTRQIHICRRLQQNNLSVFHTSAAYIAVALGCKRDIGCLSKGIQYTESNIVAGAGIFAADVPQPNKEIFHLI